MARHLHLLAAAVTDRTFERTRLDDRPVWVGKCIHCNSKLVVADDGRSLGEATLEHIIPQTQTRFNRSSQHAVVSWSVVDLPKLRLVSSIRESFAGGC